MDAAHSSSDQDLLAAENEELRDLCCYLDDDRLRLKQSVQKWKDRYYQLYMSSKRQCRCCGPTKRQRLTELKETAMQLYDLKVQVESDLHHHDHYSQGSPNTQEVKSGMNVMCELILLDNLLSVAWQELVHKLQPH